MSSLKCLYVHDHTFKKKGNDYYSEGKITDAVFARYVSTLDKLKVYSRMEETILPESLTKITAKNVRFLPVQGQNFSRIFTINLLKNIKSALAEIREADFIVVRLPSFLGIFILFLNLFFKKKYFVELVGDAKEALLTSKVEISFSFKIFVSFFAFLNAFFVKRADGVIYVTESALQNKYPTIALQSYASNVELRIEDKLLNLQTYQNEKSYFKIGMIGSFNNSYKGIDDAIRAVYMLSKKENIVHLHILGSGKLKSEYLAMAKEMGLVDNIIFDDVLSGGAEVNQWLDSLDLYIQPSRTEGLPRALIEAMARGLPAVATNVGGIPELLPSEFLIPPNAPQELANKIELLISSQQLRYEQGRANYNKAREYDSEILRQRRTKFWNQAKAIVEKDLK